MRRIAFSAGLVALLVGASPFVATGDEPASADWSVHAEWSALGAPYCYVHAVPAAGVRVTAARAGDRLLLVLRLESLRPQPERIVVDLRVGDAVERREAARVDGRALTFSWAADTPLRAALATAEALHLVLPDGSARVVPLMGSGPALDALETCYADHAQAHAQEIAAWQDPLKTAADPGPLDATRAQALATGFERWFAQVWPAFTPEVRAPAAEHAPFVVKTTAGEGAIHLLAGHSHADVIANGIRRVRAGCPGRGRLVEHDRHDFNGLVVQRSTLVCAAEERMAAAVIVSFCDDPGGLAFVLAAGAAGGHLAARLVEDLAAREGFALRLEVPSLGSS